MIQLRNLFQPLSKHSFEPLRCFFLSREAPGTGVFPIPSIQRSFANSSRGDGEASWKIGTLVGSQLSLLEA